MSDPLVVNEQVNSVRRHLEFASGVHASVWSDGSVGFTPASGRRNVLLQKDDMKALLEVMADWITA